MKNVAVIILAAGEGTRMRSETPKVLHKVCGKPMISWVLESVKGLKPEDIYVVVGHKSRIVKEAAADSGALFVEQKQQLGSGHAFMQAGKKLSGRRGSILVLCADTPLIKTDTLAKLIDFHRSEGNAATVLSVINDNPRGYGRIVRSPLGQVERIVEEKDASPDIRRVKEINSGIYCFESPFIWKVAKKIRPNNIKKEYYLTDTLDILNELGEKTGAYSITDTGEVLGVNSRVELAGAEKVKRTEILERLMISGVTIIDPACTYISADTAIGNDTVIYPGTVIEGRTVIGSGCHIGPSAFIADSALGNDIEINCAHISRAKIGNGAKIAPFTRVKHGTVIKPNERVGEF